MGASQKLEPVVSQRIQELLPQFVGDDQPSVKLDGPTHACTLPLLAIHLLAIPSKSPIPTHVKELGDQSSPMHPPRAVVIDILSSITAAIALAKLCRTHRAGGDMAGCCYIGPGWRSLGSNCRVDSRRVCRADTRGLFIRKEGMQEYGRK